jgi:hypothetical protein
MDKVQKYNSFNTNTPSSESYRNYSRLWSSSPWRPQLHNFKWSNLCHSSITNWSTLTTLESARMRTSSFCILYQNLLRSAVQWQSYGPNDPGVQFSAGALRPERLCGPPSLLSNGYRGPLSPGVKRSGCEADHSTPSSAEVTNAWSYTSTPQYTFTVRCLIKHWTSSCSGT